eukprot:9188635-Pyramimonas_sp.AAC.1
MEGDTCSKCGSRLSPAHICLQSLQPLKRWRAARFQNVSLASAPRTPVVNVHRNLKDSHC